MEDLETRELRYFVAVAERLNFSHAAEHLGMAQPPLSRAIRRLERRLGVELFERAPRGLVLTPAGETLLDEARAALDAIAKAARRTRRVGERSGGVLVIAAKPGIAGGLLKRVVDSYNAQGRTPQAEVVVSAYRQEADMVRDGRADLALVSSPNDPEGLDTEVLSIEPRVLALPAGHELTRLPELRCRDFADLVIPEWADSTPAKRAYWTGRDVTDRRLCPALA